MAAEISKEAEICNARGLHARAAAKLVKCVETFNADIRISHNGMTVGGLSIMGLLMLGAGKGKTVTVSATGADAQKALEAVCTLIQDKFGENE